MSPDGEQDLKEEINCEVLRLCDSLATEEAGLQHPLSPGEKTKGGLRATRGAA